MINKGAGWRAYSYRPVWREVQPETLRGEVVPGGETQTLEQDGEKWRALPPSWTCRFQMPIGSPFIMRFPVHANDDTVLVVFSERELDHHDGRGPQDPRLRRRRTLDDAVALQDSCTWERPTWRKGTATMPSCCTAIMA